MTVSVLWLFLAVPWVGLEYVIVVFPGHTRLQFGTNRVCMNTSFSQSSRLEVKLLSTCSSVCISVYHRPIMQFTLNMTCLDRDIAKSKRP